MSSLLYFHIFACNCSKRRVLEEVSSSWKGKKEKKRYTHIHIRTVCTLHKVTLLCAPFGIEVSFFHGILFLKALRLLCQQHTVFWETVGLKMIHVILTCNKYPAFKGKINVPLLYTPAQSKECDECGQAESPSQVRERQVLLIQHMVHNNLTIEDRCPLYRKCLCRVE